MTSWGCEALVDVIILLVSEVVTNAVLHARSDVELRLVGERDHMRVEISDSCALVPVLRERSEDAMTGRGLQLVAQLASSWGVSERVDGKTVWFELAA